MRWCAQIRGIYQHGVMLQRCINVTVATLTMHNVGMFGIIDWAGNNNRVRACLCICPFYVRKKNTIECIVRSDHAQLVG